MASYDEIQNIILNVQGRDQVDLLRKSVELEEESLRKLIRAHGLFDTATQASAVKLRQLQDDLRTAEKSLRSVGGGFASYQQNITAASYALQDFTSTSGDLGAKLNSVTNNLPMLFAGMGGLGVAISTAGTAATALYRNWDSLTGLFTTRNPFPETTTTLGELEKQLEKSKEAMDKLTKAGSGTATEMERYKAIREDIANAETRIAEQKERQAAVDEVMKSRTKEDEERGQAFDEAVAGRGPQFRADIIAARNKQADSEIRKFTKNSEDKLQKLLASGATNDELIKAAEVEKQAIASYSRTVKTGIEDLADKLIKDLHAGKAGAVTKLRNLMDAGTGIVIGGEGFRKAFEDAQPESKKAEQAAALNAEFEDPALGDKALADINKQKEDAKRRAEQEKAKTDAETKRQEQEAGQKRQHDEAVRKQAQRERDQINRELEAGLGDDFIAEGQRRMLEIGQMRGPNKAAAQEQFRNQYRDAAFQQLRNRGVDRVRASELAAEALGFTNRDLGDQLSRLADTNRDMSRSDLLNTLYELLGQGGGEAHPDVAGAPTDVRPRRGFRSVPPTAPGGGFRSVPPTAPGAGAQAPGNTGDAVVQAIGKVADAAKAGDAINAAHIARIDGFVSQLVRAVQQMGGQLSANARRGYQGGDTYLPTTW